MRTAGMTEIRTLVSVAIPGDGAQKLTEAIVRATELAEEEAVTKLATKSDLAELKAATKSDLAELKAATKSDLAELKAATKSDLAELKAATKSDFAELKANLAELKADLVRWMFGAGITLTALIVGAVYFIVNLKH
jgi:hypothetical protein